MPLSLQCKDICAFMVLHFTGLCNIKTLKAKNDQSFVRYSHIPLKIYKTLSIVLIFSVPLQFHLNLPINNLHSLG